VDVVIEVDPSTFSQVVVDTESDLDKKDIKVLRMTQALALATAKRDQKKGGSTYTMRGKSVRFDGVELNSEPHARPGPVSRQAADVEEIVSPAVQALMGKGKVPAVAKTATMPPLVTSKAKEALKAPTTAASSMAPPVAAPTAKNPTPALNQYRYSFALEDKEADKRMVERLLDSNLNIPMHKLFAISPDVRKQFHDLTTTKRVTVGMVSVNELSSQLMIEEFICTFDQERLHSDDGKVVVDHFVPLHCICTVTVGGRVLTCVLDQGTEVVVMPKDVWCSLGLGLHTVSYYLRVLY
jgi:hypothetical protein